TEVGRQPFTVYGLLRTADSVSRVSREQVVTSTWGILLFYLLVFGIGLWVLMRLLREPPRRGELYVGGGAQRDEGTELYSPNKHALHGPL
ncbi:cytochrome ubiquinol oxidase subunit I, partial [Mesorhizobium japonicum]|uniref:cytochrome ubiquinol oxidase subunit I n=1 Tax=Mesorhizobium japonicum TaxID=2066070 RepID=UPI003B598BB5